MLPKLIAITHVSDVLFYLLNIYFVSIHTNFLKYISTVIKFYFRLHRWISLYHLMYVYIAWQNSLQSNTHIVFKYFIFHCTCKVPLFSYLKKTWHLIILWCVKTSLKSGENRIFLESVGSKTLYHDYHMIMEDPQLITNERDMFNTLIALIHCTYNV